MEVIESLGIIIYKALDYGLKDNEERELSPPLEQLIDHMTNTSETDGSKDEGYDALDEGVEDDDDEKEEVEAIRSYKDVMKLCAAHLPTRSEAPNHYQAVCRALFAETMELYTFLAKIKSAKEDFLLFCNSRSRVPLKSRVRFFGLIQQFCCCKRQCCSTYPRTNSPSFPCSGSRKQTQQKQKRAIISCQVNELNHLVKGQMSPRPAQESCYLHTGGRLKPEA